MIVCDLISIIVSLTNALSRLEPIFGPLPKLEGMGLYGDKPNLAREANPPYDDQSHPIINKITIF